MSAAASITPRVPLVIRRRPGRKTVVMPVQDGARAVATRADPALKTLARAFRYQRLLDEERYAAMSEMAAAGRIERGYWGSLLRLTLLAPDIVDMILDGRRHELPRLPRSMTPFPAAWSDQRAAMAASDVLPEGSGEACRRVTRIARHHHTHPCW